MHRIVSSLFFFCAITLLAPVPATAVMINWSPVGNPGTATDPADGGMFTAGIQNFGADACFVLKWRAPQRAVTT